MRLQTFNVAAFEKDNDSLLASPDPQWQTPEQRDGTFGQNKHFWGSFEEKKGKKKDATAQLC